MKRIIITILGILINVLVYLFIINTKYEINLIVPQLYLLFILPLILILSIIISWLYNYIRQKNKHDILLKMLMVFFLLLIIIQFLLFSNDVLVKWRQKAPAIRRMSTIKKVLLSQLNRLVKTDAYNGFNNSTNVWTPNVINDYKESLSYDPNGNIKSYLRNGTGSFFEFK